MQVNAYIKVTFINGTKLSEFHFTGIFRVLILAIFTTIAIVNPTIFSFPLHKYIHTVDPNEYHYK